MIGLSQKGTSSFDQITATTLLYGPESTGWNPAPIVLARLGMKKELETDLQNFPGRWQIYCNGWGHWGLEGEVNKDAEWYFRTNMVRDVESPDGEKNPSSNVAIQTYVDGINVGTCNCHQRVDASEL